jgi:hypothetical protein
MTNGWTPDEPVIEFILVDIVIGDKILEVFSPPTVHSAPLEKTKSLSNEVSPFISLSFCEGKLMEIPSESVIGEFIQKS